MKQILDLMWGFDLIFQKNNPKAFMFLKFLGCLFLGYVILHPYFFGFLEDKSNPLQTKDFIVFFAYVLIFIFGVALNLKFLDVAFFKDVFYCLLVVAGRVLFLTLIEFSALFVIKLLAMMIFKISPEIITKNSSITDIVWYYPLIQLPYFFFQYRRNKTLQQQHIA